MPVLDSISHDSERESEEESRKREQLLQDIAFLVRDREKVAMLSIFSVLRKWTNLDGALPFVRKPVTLFSKDVI